MLSVAVYQDLSPFNDNGQGIDVDLAGALAEGLGVKLSLLAFGAGENIGDDLRNAVWRGHFLGWGPADVMLHVPLDRPLINRAMRSCRCPRRAPRATAGCWAAPSRKATPILPRRSRRLVELSAGPALREMFSRHGVNWKA